MVADGDQHRTDDSGRVSFSPRAHQVHHPTRRVSSIAAVAAAQGLPLVNAGFAYDTEIIERLPSVGKGFLIERLEPSDLTTRFHVLDPELELSLRPFLSNAQAIVDRLGCEVVLRAFDPAGLTALYLVNRSAIFAEELRETSERVDEVWADVLRAISAKKLMKDHN